MTPRSPGPPNQPNTFWAPCATKITPRTTRTMRRDVDAKVPKSMSMAAPPAWMEKLGSTLIRSGRTVVNADRERGLLRVESGDVEAIQARGVAAGDLRLLVVRHARQDLG